MGTKPRVSVITNFLNAEKFLDEAIGSVLVQTYDNWELLLVDDGSTDTSPEIAKAYARRHPGRLRYLEHEGHCNKGMSASKNLGIQEAQGEFIAFLDADDVWLPEKLTKQVAVMEENPDVGLIFNRIFLWREDGSKKPVQTLTLAPGKHPPGMWIREILKNANNYLSPSTVLLRRSAIMEVGGFEKSFHGLLHLFEDLVTWFKISLKTTIYYDPEATLLYREHSSSCWGSSSWEERQLGRTFFFQWFIRYLKNSPYAESTQEIMEAMTFRLNAAQLRYFVDTNQMKAAEAVYRWAELQLGEQPKDAEWNYLTAFCLQNRQIRLEEALRRYDMALKSGYEEFWVRYNRGSLHAHLGNLKEAREDLERAITINPGHEGVRQVLHKLS